MLFPCREESKKPGVWAQICMQRIIELAKESSTMRRILEPVFIFFDSRKLWIPDNGLSTLVLSDISCLVNGSGAESCADLEELFPFWMDFEFWLANDRK